MARIPYFYNIFDTFMRKSLTGNQCKACPIVIKSYFY